MKKFFAMMVAVALGSSMVAGLSGCEKPATDTPAATTPPAEGTPATGGEETKKD